MFMIRARGIFPVVRLRVALLAIAGVAALPVRLPRTFFSFRCQEHLCHWAALQHAAQRALRLWIHRAGEDVDMNREEILWADKNRGGVN